MVDGCMEPGHELYWIPWCLPAQVDIKPVSQSEGLELGTGWWYSEVHGVHATFCTHINKKYRNIKVISEHSITHW